MANILDFLRGLMTNGREQEQFGVGPEEYLASHGYADLSGEDVTEAMRVLTPALPADVGSKLSCYVDDDGSLPSVRPQMDENELDAAVRQLRFAVALAATAVVEQPGTATDGTPGLDSAADAPMSEAEAETRDQPERQPVSDTIQSTPPLTGQPAGVAGDTDTAALEEELATIASRASGQMKDLLRRADEQAAEILRRAQQEAESVRQQAGYDAQIVRQSATQEAESMVQTANAQREAADVELQRALIAQEDAQRQAAEIRQSAEQESNAIIGEAKARRDEIRAAEQELRNRLQGLESVFRALDQGSVVPDEVS